MSRFGFVIDNRKCIGCHACTVACKSEHQVPIGVDRTWVKYIEKGAFPNNRRMFSVMRCNHCDSAPCVAICPVTALFRREDGIVDFNSDRCIGCKACLQACPYDALYIDPDSNTAAKCNYCTHRLEVNLEPSCVTVCPERAIIAGDIDDPSTEISQLIDRHSVQVRKPEKGTDPKLFYIEGDAASLVPGNAPAGNQYMWSGDSAIPLEIVPSIAKDSTSPRRVYDVRPRKPAWGWHVAAYTWTKSIATGSFLAAAFHSFFLPGISQLVQLAFCIVAILSLIATGGLLVADLKRPERFLYVLLRPQWSSWLVRGAYLLLGFGIVLVAWLIAIFAGAAVMPNIILLPGVVLAVLAAVYTAFLLAQAKGRDYWQNPMLALHLLIHALLAGGAIWVFIDAVFRGSVSIGALCFFAAAIAVSLVVLVFELLTTPPTADARLAAEMIVRGQYRLQFWVGGIGVGHFLPLALLSVNSVGSQVAAGFAALAGLYIIERIWILAPQQIELS